MTEDLAQQIMILQGEINILSTDIHAETHPVRKENLINKKAEKANELNYLRAKQEAYEQKFYDEKINELIKENRIFILLKINGRQINIPPSLTVEIAFSPCGHKEKMNVKELLRGYEFQENKRLPEINARLYNKWNQLLTSTATITTSLNCLQCRSKFEEIKRKFGRWSDKEVGHCAILLRRLQ